MCAPLIDNQPVMVTSQLNIWLTKSMEQNHSWEASSYSASEIPLFKVCYRFQHRPPLVPILSQIILAHSLPAYFFNIHFNIILLYTSRSSKWSLPLKVSPQNPVCAIPPFPKNMLRAPSTSSSFDHPNSTWPGVKTTKLLSERNFLQGPVISLHLATGVFFSALFSNTLILCSLRWVIKFHAHIIPYPTAFPYGNGMVLHFYQQQESSTTKTVHKVINKGLKAYV